MQNRHRNLKRCLLSTIFVFALTIQTDPRLAHVRTLVAFHCEKSSMRQFEDRKQPTPNKHRPHSLHNPAINVLDFLVSHLSSIHSDTSQWLHCLSARSSRLST